MRRCLGRPEILSLLLLRIKSFTLLFSGIPCASYLIRHTEQGASDWKTFMLLKNMCFSGKGWPPELLMCLVQIGLALSGSQLIVRGAVGEEFLPT